jgi:hypothetical protein
VTDVGKEIGSLAKHVTGEDLAVKGADGDTLGESRNRTDSGTVTQNSSETQTQTSTATQMWSAFGSMAKSSLKAVERAASQVVSDPSIKSFASRSLDAAKNAVTRLEKKANEFQNAVMSANGGTDAATISRIADQAGVALEQGLIERTYCISQIPTVFAHTGLTLFFYNNRRVRGAPCTTGGVGGRGGCVCGNDLGGGWFWW